MSLTPPAPSNSSSTVTTSLSDSTPNSTSSTTSTTTSDSSISSDGTTTTTTTKTSSSYYFFKSTPSEEAERYKPKRIDAASAAATDAAAALVSGGSSWNAAGTWEEKDISKWACDRITQLLLADGGVNGSKDGATSHISSVKSVTGDASLVYTRGKKRVGFDLVVNAEYVGEYDGVSATGTIELPCVDEQTEDEEWEVRVFPSTEKEKESAVSEQVCAAMKSGIGKIRNQIGLMVKELKELK